MIPLLGVLLLGSLATWVLWRDADPSLPQDPAPAMLDVERPAPSRETFDFYLLALTSHPAFCADGHGRKPECRTGASIPLSIHGLWPERLEAGRYPRDCPGPELDLDPGFQQELSRLMPGMSDGLHQHEWRRHGTCTGLGDDEYFAHTLAFARRVEQALSARLATLAGRTTSAAELREFADRYAPGIGATLTFHCRTLRQAPAGHRQEPHLVEIRQCLEDDGPGNSPHSPIHCATVNRRDQGCGREFRIAERWP